jgi:antitoxin (DNA-binding transcriptional repressor) of toxin-antitoxin stability system
VNQVTAQEVQQHLMKLLADLNPGEGLQIIAEGRVVGQLIAGKDLACVPRQPGSAVGNLTIVADDDEHLRDFANYMS